MGRRWEAENEANGGKENMLPTLVEEEELEFLFSLSLALRGGLRYKARSFLLLVSQLV